MKIDAKAYVKMLEDEEALIMYHDVGRFKRMWYKKYECENFDFFKTLTISGSE